MTYKDAKRNTRGLLHIFVYGTLKRGMWNHERFCAGARSIREAVVRERLYEMDCGLPVLQVPEADILAHGTADRPLIYNRDGCHRWQPELFAEDDPRHGYTWQDCHNDAVALLGSEEVVRAYVESGAMPGAAGPQKRSRNAPNDMLF